jgi:hypothetical protein
MLHKFRSMSASGSIQVCGLTQGSGNFAAYHH